MTWFWVPTWALCPALGWPSPMWSSFIRMKVASGSVLEGDPLPPSISASLPS